MIKALVARLRQGHRTTAYPDGPPPPLPDRFRGRPLIREEACPAGCGVCVAACPTRAIQRGPDGRLALDLGACLFCPDCERACPENAISYSQDYRLAAVARERLVLLPDQEQVRAEALKGRLLSLFKRSLRLRVVSAGGCNGCESDVNVLGTVGWDLGRFGIQFVASPRHADGLLITGPVSENMRAALLETYAAVPGPKIVVAVGACAISGGPFVGNPEVHDGVPAAIPVDLYVPGCPPHPLTILDGLVRLLDRAP